MYQTITTHQAIKQLLADKDANWSYGQACVIVEYLETLEHDLEKNFEFDPEVIREEFLGYPSAVEAVWDYVDMIGETRFRGTQAEALEILRQNGVRVLKVDETNKNTEIVTDTFRI